MASINRRSFAPLTALSLACSLLPISCSDDDSSSETGGRSGVGGGTESGGQAQAGGSTSGGSATMGGEAGGPAGGTTHSAGSGGDAGAAFEGKAPSSQFPPTTASEMEAWLDGEHYLEWACEEEATVKDFGTPPIHVHGASSRVCSNVLLATSRSGTLPAGVASVKEVYDDSGSLVVRAVAAKVQADSDEGNGWYWYEGESAAGFGLSSCTGCHAAAGSDDDHPGAGDFVYYQETDEENLPPTGDREAVTAWLDAGHYEAWDCEAEPTLKTSGDPAIHVHDTNRVCSNPRLASAALSNGEWPAGIASVKEIYDGDTVIARDVYVKVTQTNDGLGFFYYGGASTLGFGAPGCTGCHSAAGSDADHPGAGDFVYFTP
jgi:hypothetical protein